MVPESSTSLVPLRSIISIIICFWYWEKLLHTSSSTSSRYMSWWLPGKIFEYIQTFIFNWVTFLNSINFTADERLVRPVFNHPDMFDCVYINFSLQRSTYITEIYFLLLQRGEIALFHWFRSNLLNRIFDSVIWCLKFGFSGRFLTKGILDIDCI